MRWPALGLTAGGSEMVAVISGKIRLTLLDPPGHLPLLQAHTGGVVWGFSQARWWWWW